MDEIKNDVPKELDSLDETKLIKQQLYPDQDLDVTFVRPVAKRSPSGIPANLEIDFKEWKRIELDIEDYIKDIDDSKSELLDKLDKWQNALNQEYVEGDWGDEPFENSCKLCSDLVATTANVVYRKISNTILVEPYFLSKVKGDRSKERLLQDAINNLCAYDIDFETTAKQVIWNATTAPYVVMNPENVREIITHHDFKIIEPVLDKEGKIIKKGSAIFKELYATPEDAGLTESQYDAKLQHIDEDCELVGSHEFEFDNEVVEETSVINVIPISLYYKFPWDASVPHAKLLGGIVEKIYDSLVKDERDGIVNKGFTNLLAKRYENPENTTVIDVPKMVDGQVSGLVPSNGTKINYRTKVYKILKGIIRLDKKYVVGSKKDTYLDYDYEFWYAMDEKTLLRIAPSRYNYKNRNYVEAKISNQCIPAQTYEAYKVVTTCLRQFIDGNSMANVPQMQMSEQTYNKLKQSGFDFTHKVGKVWTAVSGEITKFEMQRPDGSQYMAIIQHITQGSEARTGGNRSAAGQNLPDDPEAPGVKVMALINQSDQQIQDYIQSLRPSFSVVAKHLIQQKRQRMKSDKMSLKVYDIKNGTQNVDVSRDDLSFIDENTQFLLRNQKVDDNDQMRKQEAIKTLETYMAIQQVAERPQSVRMLTRNAMMRDSALTIDEIDQILPTDEQLKQEQAEVMAEVQRVQQIEQEKANMMKIQEQDLQNHDAQTTEQINQMGA